MYIYPMNFDQKGFQKTQNKIIQKTLGLTPVESLNKQTLHNTYYYPLISFRGSKSPEELRFDALAKKSSIFYQKKRFESKEEIQYVFTKCHVFDHQIHDIRKGESESLVLNVDTAKIPLESIHHQRI